MRVRFLLLFIPAACFAGTVRIELTGVGEHSPVVFTSTGQDTVTMAKPGPRSGSTAAFTFDEPLWTCTAGKGVPQAAGPRIFVLGSDNAGTWVDAAAVCGPRGENIRNQVPVRIALAPPAEIRLFAWLKSQSPGAANTMSDEIANANWIFRRNLAGIHFTLETKVVPASVSSAVAENDCIAVRHNPAIFREGGINLYPGWGTNITCQGDDNRDFLPNVIFLQDPPILGYTAHELAHANGVNQPDCDPERSYSNGHTPPAPGPSPKEFCKNQDLAVPGTAPQPPPAAGDGNRRNGRVLFSGVNTLWPGSMLLDDHLALGQVFWMNFSCGSYVAIARDEARQKANPKARSTCLPCPNGCPYFRTTYPGTFDPRLDSSAAAPVTRDAAMRQTACGAVGQECPPGLFEQIASFLHSDDFDRQFRLAAALPGVPKYCSQVELTDNLRLRFREICGPGINCGHPDADKFVDFWKRQIVVAGLMDYTVRQAQSAYESKMLGGTGTCEKDPKCRGNLASASADGKRYISGGGLSNLAGKKILWMDATQGNLKEQQLLRAIGVEIECSNSVVDAIEKLRGSYVDRFRGRSPYAAIVSNFGKDRNGGPSAAFSLLAKRNEAGLQAVPLLIYTSNVSADEVNGAKKAGVYDETDNPFTLIRSVICAITGCRAGSS